MIRKLKDHKFLNSLSIQEIAKDLKISPLYLSQLLNGVRQPGKGVAFRINHYLGLPQGPEDQQIQDEKKKRTPQPKIKECHTSKSSVSVKPKQKNPPKITHNRTAKIKINKD